ncbi:MAG: hypothetical protein AB2A00_06285 [Myxococcota bacterium]
MTLPLGSGCFVLGQAAGVGFCEANPEQCVTSDASGASTSSGSSGAPASSSSGSSSTGLQSSSASVTSGTATSAVASASTSSGAASGSASSSASSSSGGRTSSSGAASTSTSAAVTSTSSSGAASSASSAASSSASSASSSSSGDPCGGQCNPEDACWGQQCWTMATHPGFATAAVVPWSSNVTGVSAGPRLWIGGDPASSPHFSVFVPIPYQTSQHIVAGVVWNGTAFAGTNTAQFVTSPGNNIYTRDLDSVTVAWAGPALLRVSAGVNSSDATDQLINAGRYRVNNVSGQAELYGTGDEDITTDDLPTTAAALGDYVVLGPHAAASGDTRVAAVVKGTPDRLYVVSATSNTTPLMNKVMPSGTEWQIQGVLDPGDNKALVIAHAPAAPAPNWFLFNSGQAADNWPIQATPPLQPVLAGARRSFAVLQARSGRLIMAAAVNVDCGAAPSAPTVVRFLEMPQSGSGTGVTANNLLTHEVTCNQARSARWSVAPPVGASGPAYLLMTTDDGSLLFRVDFDASGNPLHMEPPMNIYLSLLNPLKQPAGLGWDGNAPVMCTSQTVHDATRTEEHISCFQPEPAP